MNDNDDFENLTPEEKLQKENELLKLKTKSGRLFIDKYGITIEGKKENFEFKYNES